MTVEHSIKVIKWRLDELSEKVDRLENEWEDFVNDEQNSTDDENMPEKEESKQQRSLETTGFLTEQSSKSECTELEH